MKDKMELYINQPLTAFYLGLPKVENRVGIYCVKESLQRCKPIIISLRVPSKNRDNEIMR